MHIWRWAVTPLVLGLFLVTASAVRADRVPSEKAVLPRDPGARGDITVPYLNNGFTTLGVYQGVAPLVYASPTVYDPKNPQIRPVFNLPFYGATRSFGDLSDGAVSKPKPRVPH
jgi:hypothetical protein